MKNIYHPKTELEARLFPNLGLARIVGGIPEYIGKVGVIVEEDREVARIVFEHFWDRPNGMSPEEAQDNTWVFPSEYVRIQEGEL